MTDEKTIMTWDEAMSLIKMIVPPDSLLYGVPRGGMIAAGFAADSLPGCELSHDPSIASFILDDIIDSGRTRDYYRGLFPHIPFGALVDKTKSQHDPDLGWVVFPWEEDHPMKIGSETSIEDSVIRQLQHIGEDPDREGLKETPGRVIRSWRELYSGYQVREDELPGLLTSFEDGSCDEMVILRDIEFYSTCEHHMLPFSGRAHIAYIPNGRVVGVSKLARLLEIFSRRLQIQERICQEITAALDRHLRPQGSACVIEAAHLCMQCRGVQKQNSRMITSSLTGSFRDMPEARSEFLSLLR